MGLFKIVVLVLGLAAAAFAAKYALDRTTGSDDPSGVSEPKRQLDAVREKARELERAEQRHADSADPGSGN